MRENTYSDNIRLIPKAVIQVDCDGENALSSYYGMERGKGADKIYPVLLRFLDIFNRYGIKATFFVVGKDIEDGMNRRFIVKALDAGHELANHTYSHPRFFLKLKKHERIAQILLTQQVLQKHLGVKAYGFRAPNFELDEELIEILSGLGLKYDSSMLSTPFSPLLRTVKRCINIVMDNSRTRSGYLGRASFSLAPRSVFIPSKQTVWKKSKKMNGGLNVFEVPIVTSPYGRIPCHASYALAYPDSFRYAITERTIKWYAQKGFPLVYVFHLCDLCEPEFMYLPESRWYGEFEGRLKFVEWVCSQLSRNFSCITTLELIEAIF